MRAEASPSMSPRQGWALPFPSPAWGLWRGSGVSTWDLRGAMMYC